MNNDKNSNVLDAILKNLDKQSSVPEVDSYYHDKIYSILQEKHKQEKEALKEKHKAMKEQMKQEKEELKTDQDHRKKQMRDENRKNKEE